MGFLPEAPSSSFGGFFFVPSECSFFLSVASFDESRSLFFLLLDKWSRIACATLQRFSFFPISCHLPFSSLTNLHPNLCDSSRTVSTIRLFSALEVASWYCCKYSWTNFLNCLLPGEFHLPLPRPQQMSDDDGRSIIPLLLVLGTNRGLGQIIITFPTFAT